MQEFEAIEDIEIPLPNIDIDSMNTLVDFFETADPASFFNDFDSAKLITLTNAAVYLDCESLLDALVQQIARGIVGKTPEEIRKAFNITNDFTPEEEAQIRAESAWAFVNVTK
jgi:hypothetical protein